MRHRSFIRPRSGFTVTELLVVIGILVMMLTIGVAGWRALTGASSVAGAQNLASAYVARVRAQAVSAPGPRGVVFFQRQGEERVFMGVVYEDDPNAHPGQLELVPDTDLEPLQSGVAALFLEASGAAGSRRHTLPGVFLFDQAGQVYLRSCSIRRDSRLGQLAGLNADWAGQTSLAVSFCLLDRYQNRPEAERSAWLDVHGQAMYINRYTGSLMSGR